MVTEDAVTAGALALAKRNNASSHEPFMGISRAVLESALSAQVQDVAELDADEIAAAISTAACELGDVPDPEGDDTISITVRDLEAIAHRQITVAIERAAAPAKQE